MSDLRLEELPDEFLKELPKRKALVAVKSSNQEDLQQALVTSFVDKTFLGSEETLRAKLLFNDAEPGNPAPKKISDEVVSELKECTSFDFSVAFITDSGLAILRKTFLELREKGIKGRVLTTDYNLFSEPKALRELASFSNLEVRMYESKESGFHTKAFIFHKEELDEIIIGSSNLTDSALTRNKEWNVKLISTPHGELVDIVKNEFEKLWDHPHSKPIEDVIDTYEVAFTEAKELRKRILASASSTASLPAFDRSLRPNKMQRQFIRNLKKLYLENKTKALLISATGTGKTYAAAFAVKSLMSLSEEEIRKAGRSRKIERVLFIVHREQIAVQARDSFFRVIGNQNGRTYGVLSGNTKGINADFVFCTIQTLSKDLTLASLEPNRFDFIIIDESHHAPAESYQKILKHFQPQFWLGMTASPDRPDEGDVYQTFDHNIAYEIRLQDAMDNDFLCPFHYYGVSDLRFNGESTDFDNWIYTSMPQRAQHLLKIANEYRFSGDRVKGLIFCSRIEEARALSDELNKAGLQTCALSGADSPEERFKAVELLAHGEGICRFDYILTVDIFNEGVDVPEINQVIFMRQTKSPIIFVQQLGRGLRKSANKDYVVILDFIGNYTNEYLLTVALSGDNSYDKDKMRKFVTLGSKLLIGPSTIEFDKVVKERIFASIDSARLNSLALLKESFAIVRNQLGHIPELVDYQKHNGIDAVKFFDHSGSYYAFLKKVLHDELEPLSSLQEGMLKFLSGKIGNGKRASEALLIELLLNNPSTRASDFLKVMKAEYGIELSRLELQSVILVLSNQFNLTQQEKERNTDFVFVEPVGQTDFRMAGKFKEALSSEHSEEFKKQLKWLLAFIRQRYNLRYKDRYRNLDLTLYEKYTYEDICRLLNWPKYISAQNIGGYRYDPDTETFPVCVNYHKPEDGIPYEDRFENERLLTAISKTGRATSSKDADIIYRRSPEYKDTKFLLFVRKNKDDEEAKTFYFLGEIRALGEPMPVEVTDAKDKTKKKNAFQIKYELKTKVRDDIYEYLTGI